VLAQALPERVRAAAVAEGLLREVGQRLPLLVGEAGEIDPREGGLGGREGLGGCLAGRGGVGWGVPGEEAGGERGEEGGVADGDRCLPSRIEAGS